MPQESRYRRNERCDSAKIFPTEFFAQFSQALKNVPTITLAEKAKDHSAQDAKTTIELAKIRTQIKKLEKQLSVRLDPQKQEQLDALQTQLKELQEV